MAYYTWAAAAVDVGNHSCTGLTNVFYVHCGASNNGDVIRLLQRTSRKCMVIRKIPVHAVGPSYPSCFFLSIFDGYLFLCQRKNKKLTFSAIASSCAAASALCLYVQQSACGRRTRKESGSRLPSNSLRNPVYGLEGQSDFSTWLLTHLVPRHIKITLIRVVIIMSIL